MIWSAGKILPDDALKISVHDRTFEHGLGLFETLRTWGGRPTLLERHKARMLRSASELNLPIDPASLPDADAVRTLLEAEDAEGDRLLRITASGGTATSSSVVWMRSGPLPEPIGEGGASLFLGPWEVTLNETLARHKTLNYWARRRAFEEARRRGFDEVLSLTFPPHEEIFFYHEGSRTNLFVIDYHGIRVGPLGTRRPVLVTSSTAAPIVPGIMREIVIEIAGELSLEVAETDLGIDGSDSMKRFKEIFLTNSVRGIIPVSRACGSAGERFQSRWQTPGPWTRRLQEILAKRLWPGPGEDFPQ